MDNATATEIRELRKELKSEFSTISKRLAKLEREQSAHDKRTTKQNQSLSDALAWNQFVNDAILCGVCLSLSLTIAGIDYIKGRVCPQLPGWAIAAIPFNFCGGGTAQPAADWRAMFEGGSDSAMAIAVGNAEGTRTPDGGKTAVWASHTDPGNGVTNLGTFSYQHGARSPEEADQKQLTRLRGQLEAIAPQLMPLNPDIKTWLNAADLLNQSPAAGQNFPKYLKQCNGDILCARVKSYEGDAPGITRNGITIEQDQRRRMEAIDKAVAANPDKFSLQTAVGEAIASGQVFPIPGKTHSTADFTSGYGPRSSPGGIGSSFHRGLDYAAPVGTPTVAVESGTVSVWQDGGCGNGIELKAGRYSYIYCHLDQVKVSDGQRVEAGQVIATIGNTGASTGPHLHIGKKVNGEYVDPTEFFKSLPSNLASNAPKTASSEAQAYFGELKGFEFGDGGFSPRRSARIEVKGTPTAQDRATVQQVVSELRSLTGADYQLVEAGGDVRIHFADISTLGSLDPLYKPGNFGFFADSGNVLIASGSPLVPVTGKPLTQRERSHLIREELTQLLTGLGKDSFKYQDSIFQAAWTDVQQYTELDRQVIRLAFER